MKLLGWEGRGGEDLKPGLGTLNVRAGRCFWTLNLAYLSKQLQTCQ